MRFLGLAAALFALGVLPAQESKRAAETAKALREAGLDREQCYRVRDLQLSRGGAQIYLTDGYLIFSKPVNGRPIAAFFDGTVEGGDGEILVIPPSRAERRSLASFTGSPNLNEHFRSAVLLFSDGTASEIRRHLQEHGATKSATQGALLADRYSSTIGNLGASFEVRFLQDLLRPDHQPEEQGFFFATLAIQRLGNTDVFFDPLLRDPLTVGAVGTRSERRFFDVWTSFRAKGRPKPPAMVAFQVPHVDLDATLQPDLLLRVRSALTVKADKGYDGPLTLELSSRMRVTGATMDGQPVEVFQRDSLRSSLLRGSEDDFVLVMPSAPLQPGREYRLVIEHEGNVVLPAGNQIYFVTSRSSWYPHRNAEFATGKVRFAYPKGLAILLPGEQSPAQDGAEGLQVTETVLRQPVRFVGFNLAPEWSKTTLQKAGVVIEVYGSRKLEAAIAKPQPAAIEPSFVPRRGAGVRPGDRPVLMASVPATPVSRQDEIAREVGNALEFMTEIVGPPPLSRLAVTPIPGTFGQGFPGLIYLSTLSYLRAADRPESARNQISQLFFDELLVPHELAHQWWGNLVAPETRSDDWLMESLANYSALLVLERRKGRQAVDQLLAEYAKHLQVKDEEGNLLESTGPIVWGYRLEQSKAPGAWRVISYEKGTWILHMLRRRMGDAAFMKLLGEVRRQYERKGIGIQAFQALAASLAPKDQPDPKLEEFFDTWVYGTGMPKLQVTTAVKGKAPKVQVTATVAQTGVEDEFSALVPVDVQIAKGKSLTKWVRTGPDPVTVTWTLPAAPAKVGVEQGSVLQVR